MTTVATKDETQFLESEIRESKSAPTLGDYRLISKIGQGGIAEIYKAIQQSLDREVAVKILSQRLSSDPEIVRRFDRESYTIARLNHPHIVHVIDRGFAQGRYYFVMEYVEGASFKAVLNSPETSLATKLDILVMTLKALDYAHNNGVIHRDIKPANILIDMHGNAKVADFGIAHLVGSPDGESTRSDIVMGTMAYMSPEQKVSSAHVDCTTDLYAVGVMLYEALCGEKPLGKFKAPSEVDPQIPKGYDSLIERALASSKADRYQSAVDMKNDLLELMSSSTKFGQKMRLESVGASVTSIENIVGSCRYLDTIRENAHGATYLVENKKTSNLIVIKRFNKESVAIRESRALIGIDHPHVTKVIGAGSDGQKTVVVMEYAPGGSLADRMARIYDWPEAFDIARQMATGLSIAHKQGIIHGNLRPSNVLFDANDVIKVTDFGSPVHYVTRRNWYSPPEKGLTVKSDIYALGVITHQLMTGKSPAFHRNGDLILEHSERGLPELAQTILKKTVTLNSAERYQSCDELIADIEQLESGVYPAEKSESKQASAMAPLRISTSNEWTSITYFLIGILTGLVLGISVAYWAGLIS